MRTISFGFKQNILVFAGVFLSVYFSYHMIYGARSFSNLAQLEQVVLSKEEALAAIAADREKMESRVKLMRPDSLSLDMLEEQARLTLSYKKADEMFVVGE